MTRADAIRKIRACQVRALRAGSEEEARTAAGLGHRLKTEHGITDAELMEVAAQEAGAETRRATDGRGPTVPLRVKVPRVRKQTLPQYLREFAVANGCPAELWDTALAPFVRSWFGEVQSGRRR